MKEERTETRFSQLLGKEVTPVSIFDDFDKDQYIAVVIKDFGNGKSYTEEQSTYIVSTNDNWFNGGKTISKALWGYCTDGKDLGVRLDWYFGEWKIDYSYLLTEDEYNQLKKW